MLLEPPLCSVTARRRLKQPLAWTLASRACIRRRDQHSLINAWIHEIIERIGFCKSERSFTGSLEGSHILN